MNCSSIGAVIGTALLAISGQPALAGTVTMNDEASFNAATSGAVRGDFTDVPLPNCDGSACFGGANPLSGYASLQGVSFSTPNENGNVNVDSAFFYGSGDLPVPYAVNSVFTGTAPDILTITLPNAATAFALDFSTLFTSTTANFVLSNGFSKTVTGTAAFGTTQFIGFVSDTAFSTITLSVPNDQSWVVADFTTAAWNGVSPVPEAGTFALMFLGLVGVAAAIQRERRDPTMGA